MLSECRVLSAEVVVQVIVRVQRWWCSGLAEVLRFSKGKAEMVQLGAGTEVQRFYIGSALGAVVLRCRCRSSAVVGSAEVVQSRGVRRCGCTCRFRGSADAEKVLQWC